ncbi:MAG: DNA-3-methyladenine glycosylase I [Legionella sp.]|nr:DNA-3-methyladenine glycosylase I [Legionella sp.]
MKDDLYIAYHDEEWGAPVTHREKLFEMLILESMQAGLSWHTVLKKREAMREAFQQFSVEKLAKLTDTDIDKLLSNDKIIRNVLKIRAVRKNAQAFLRIEERENSVDYFWQFTKGQTIHNKWQQLSEVPAITPQSILMAAQLKKDGFAFMGPTTCYAFMQGVGIVNDHIESCFRWKQLTQ